jgi:hypothetical protein
MILMQLLIWGQSFFHMNFYIFWNLNFSEPLKLGIILLYSLLLLTNLRSLYYGNKGKNDAKNYK